MPRSTTRAATGTGPGASAMSAPIAAVRAFNRFYTRQIGVLDERLVQSEFSLTEVRVLYELAHGNASTASNLVELLGLDAGYISRMIGSLAKRGLVRREPSKRDRRQSLLALTPAGRSAFRVLDKRSTEQVCAMIDPLAPEQRQRLLSAMREISEMLAPRDATVAPYMLRQHGPGDMGWIVQRHGAIYAREYGWNSEFEALVAKIVAGFLESYDPARARCWIAERDGANVGSIVVVQKSKTVAQLRLLLVEPSARGLGIGRRLVAEAIKFARDTGYRSMMLWTNDSLVDARRLYEQAGFSLVTSARHHSFGKDLVEQTWSLDL